MTQQPPPPPGHYPPTPQPGSGAPMFPPANKKKRRTLLIFGILGGLIAFCCLGGVIMIASNGDSKPESTDGRAAEKSTDENAKTQVKKDEAQEEVSKEPGLNDPVRDGKFEFIVTKVDCSQTRVGNDYFGEDAQGKFCMVSVMVKNIGKKAQMFHGASQKAYDAKGTEFSNDTSAELHANEGSPTFLTDINPGNQVKGKLIFDVPKDVKLTAVELHDSLFSGGVRVKLS